MIDFKYEPKNNFTEAVTQLYEIVKCLRSPEGCPWDIKQTGKSSAICLMDELYEYLDAYEDKDKDEQCEELGDVLLNAFLMLEIHEQDGDFASAQVLNGISEKLIRRHPHVFSDAKADNVDEVLTLWNKVKKDVEGRKDNNGDDFFSKVARNQPELLKSYEVQKKAAKAGFDWNGEDGIYEKILEESREVKEAVGTDDLEEELGDLLFSVVNLCRHYKVNPEVAVHKSTLKFRNRFNEVYRICLERNIPMDKEHLDEMDAIWNEIKHK